MSKWQMTTHDSAQLSRTRASWMRTCARMALIGMALGAMAALGGCSEKKIVRYRVTINLDVDGEAKSGSGVIQTLFYGGGGVNQPNRYYTRTTGVAPVVDLGRHGWLVAVMGMDPAIFYARKRKLGLTCPPPATVHELLNVFRLEASDLVKLRTGKRDLEGNFVPILVWFPRDRSYKSALQLCPEEFAREIGSAVAFKSATIEIVPDAPFKTVLEIDAPWLHEMRIDQATVKNRPHGVFVPGRMAIENPGLALQ